MQVTDWLAQPYSPDMDVWRWVLFIGLVLVIVMGWAYTIKLLEKAL